MKEQSRSRIEKWAALVAIIISLGTMVATAGGWIGGKSKLEAEVIDHLKTAPDEEKRMAMLEAQIKALMDLPGKVDGLGDKLANRLDDLNKRLSRIEGKLDARTVTADGR